VLLPGPEYDDALRAGAYHAAALEAARAVPGVRDAALAYDVPLETTWSEGFSIVGRPESEPGTGPSARFRPVGTGYFELLDVPVLAGRTFRDADRLGAPGVAIVNRALAEQYFPGEDPVGRRIRNGTPRANVPEAPEEFEIVGVVENVAFSGPRAGPQPALYVPLGQFPITYFQVLIRTDVAPVSLVRPLADAVRGLDASVPIPDAVPLATVQSRMLARDRFLALLAGLFAAVALTVAAGGVYGVLSYAAAARRREMGVRQALGADSLAVLRLMLGNAIRLAGAGLVVGLVGAVAASRLLASTLYGVRPTDPLVLAGVLLTLLLVAIVAGLVPALRAASVDPAEALRVE
jgi:predicted permease